MARFANGVNFKAKKPPRPEMDKKVFMVLKLMQGIKTAEISRNTFLCTSTIGKLRNRRTRYPQHMTIDAIVEACQHKYAILTDEEYEMVLGIRKGASDSLKDIVTKTKKPAYAKKRRARVAA